MRIDDCKPGYADAMYPRETVAAVGIVERRSAIAVVLPDDGHVARAPQHRPASGRFGTRKSVPVRHQPKIAYRTPERLDARAAAAEQAYRAAGGMLNDLAGAKRKSRRRGLLLGRTLRLNDGSSLLSGNDRSGLLRGDDRSALLRRNGRSGLLCGNDRSSLPTVSFAGARVLRAIGPVPYGRPLSDLAAAVRMARHLRAQLPLHLRLLIGRAPNNNNRSALPAVHLADALRAIRPTGRLHRKALLAAEALTSAD